MLRKSISESIGGELTIDDLKKTSAEMIQIIATLFAERSEAVHRIFKLEEKSLQNKYGQCINDYITAHRTLRRRMHQTAYTKIQHKRTTVRFIFNGRGVHQKYRSVAQAPCLLVLSYRVAKLQERILE